MSLVQSDSVRGVAFLVCPLPSPEPWHQLDEVHLICQASTLIILGVVPLFQDFINRTKVGSLTE